MEEFGIKYIPDQPDSYRKWIKIPKILIRKVLVTCPNQPRHAIKKTLKGFFEVCALSTRTQNSYLSCCEATSL